MRVQEATLACCFATERQTSPHDALHLQRDSRGVALSSHAHSEGFIKPPRCSAPSDSAVSVRESQGDTCTYALTGSWREEELRDSIVSSRNEKGGGVCWAAEGGGRGGAGGGRG